MVACVMLLYSIVLVLCFDIALLGLGLAWSVRMAGAGHWFEHHLSISNTEA